MPLFKHDLLRIVDKLPFAATTIAAVWTGRLDPQGRRRYHLLDHRFGIIAFLAYDPGRHPVSGDGPVDEDGKSIDFGQSLSTKGHIDDFTFDNLFFFSGMESTFSTCRFYRSMFDRALHMVHERLFVKWQPIGQSSAAPPKNPPRADDRIISQFPRPFFSCLTQ